MSEQTSPSELLRSSLGEGRTVLLADDNDDSRSIYATVFMHVGFRVLEARDGREALDLASAECPDVILLNLLMPELDGHGVLGRLRSDPATESLPCLCLTGDARWEQMGKALSAGADAFLTKPAEPLEVLEVVAHLLEISGTPDG